MTSLQFLVEGGSCPKYAALQKEFKESEEVKNISAKYSQFFDYLEKHTGSPINTVDDVYLLADILVVQVSQSPFKGPPLFPATVSTCSL
jgi:hypothetical protein